MKDGIRDGKNQLCPKPGMIIRNILLLALQEQIDPRARGRMGERNGRDSDANYARVRDMYRDASRPVEDEYIRTCIPALMLHSQRATMSSQVLRILEKVKTSDQNPTFELSASYLSFLYYILCCDVFSLSMTCFPVLKETHAASTETFSREWLWETTPYKQGWRNSLFRAWIWALVCLLEIGLNKRTRTWVR